jgi:rhamnogalacturonan endolyase
LYNYGNAQSINGTKATPCLSADVLGDWREEIFMMNSLDSSQIQFFTTTIPTSYQIPTLMHDPVYRLGVAWENNCYNQPPHLGYWLARGLDSIPKPNVYLPHASILHTDQKSIQYNTLTMMSDNKGVARFRSTQPIQSVIAYSLTGNVLYKNDDVNDLEFNIAFPENQKMTIIRENTTLGLKTMKWVRQ